MLLILLILHNQRRAGAGGSVTLHPSHVGRAEPCTQFTLPLASSLTLINTVK